jgi:predicted RNA-binding Zn-ribbon protein involved in translation (DUF1610 family)
MKCPKCGRKMKIYREWLCVEDGETAVYEATAK